MDFISRARLLVLALLPTAGAAGGAWFDEYTRQGVSIWLSTCSADGLSWRSMLVFTWQLLPDMIVGTLLGGLMLVCVGTYWRGHPHLRAECTAAHLGCMVAMPLALFACSLSLSAGAMPVLDLVLTALVAFALLPFVRRLARASAVHP